MARNINPAIKIFMIDIDELECTVFGAKKPYHFGRRINQWSIKDCGAT